MAEQKNNAQCAICGTPYYLCVSCRDSIRLTPWKTHTDTSEHYKIYQILRGYTTGVYDKSEAKLKLQNVDLSDLNSFRKHIKSTIKNILKEEKVEVAATKTLDNEIATDNSTVLENKIENNKYEQHKSARKKYPKVDKE